MQPAFAATPGTVVGWGDSSWGQLDIPDGLGGVTAIVSGAGHSLALKVDGTVVAWGDNSDGQLNIPDGLSGVIAIAAGERHSLALKADGTVVAWGDGCCGQLDIPAGLSGVIAIAAGDLHNIALKADGTVIGWGDNTWGQLNIPGGLSGVTAITVGARHNLALKADGTVVGWGDGAYGRLDIPSGLNNVTAIAAGITSSLALKRDGTVVAWGNNLYGQLNIPDGLSGVTAIAAGLFHNLALKSDGTVVAWGDDRDGQSSVPDELSDVTAIAGGGNFSLAIRRDKTSPTASQSQTPAANAAGWNTSDVTVNWTWSDSGTGLDPANCTASSTSNGEGPLTLSATCQDLAGNSGSASYTVHVDKTVPVVTITGVSDGASYTLGSVPTAGCSTTDGVSGVATQATISVTGGNLDGTGSFIATCNGATDLAGNSGSASVSYTVSAAPAPPAQSLRQQVETVRSSLAALLPDSDSKTAKSLQKVLGKIDQALATNLWQTDGIHLTLIGDDVFNRLQDAVKELANLKKPPAAVTTARSTLVTISRSLAQLALDEAIAGHGNASKIAKAQSKLAKGDSEAVRARWDKAIAQYEDSWEYAQQALGLPVASSLLAEEQPETPQDLGEAGETPDDEDNGTLVNRLFLPLVTR